MKTFSSQLPQFKRIHSNHKNVFPKSKTQICFFHQIRNSSRYLVWKNKKEFSRDMKQIYDASTKQVVKEALIDFAGKWKHKYPCAVK